MEITTQFEIIKHLAFINDTSIHKTVTYKTLEEARKKCAQKCFLKVQDEQGVIHPYMEHEMRFDNPHRDIKAVLFIEERLKTFSDFGVTPKFIKKTKICEGGGWYSWGGIYEVLGKYFEE